MDAPANDQRQRLPRRRFLIPALASLLVLGAVGAIAAIDLDRSPDTGASFNADSVTTTAPTTTIAPTTTAPATTTTTTTTTAPTTTTTVALPVQLTEPIAPPADARGPENNPALGRIAIPKVGLDSELHDGIRLTTLDRGPGHWPGTAMPGQIGNVVVAGHRTSHGAEFRHLDALVPGDEVVFTTADGTFTYHVTGTQIVTPDSLWIIDPTDTPTATLFACHPLGSTAQRIVVNLALSS
jgi:sortase A